MSDTKNAPACIGIIMDGNRRWAKSQGLPSLEGHRAGYEKFKEVAEWAKDAGVKNLICYAFSTENWNRSEEEVSYLMELLEGALLKEMDELLEKGVRFRMLGQRERLSKSAQARIKELEEKSKDNTKFTLAPAISYGGHADVLQAVNTLIAEGKRDITVEDIESHLWTAGIPNPDLIIRTSGEQRLSNFLTWNSAYSELLFTETHWPALSKEEFLGMLESYGNRQRRHGK